MRQPKLARKFTTVIEIWETTTTSNNRGGSIANYTLVKQVYARKETPRLNNYEIQGMVYDKADVAFYIKNLDLNTNVHFIVYKGIKHTILNFEKTQLETQIVVNCVNTNELMIEPSI
jgi:hypothetical protein